MAAVAEIPPPTPTLTPSMTSDDVKRHIYRNSISNYTFLVVRLGLGAFMFRLIIQKLPAEDFGFWSVLWSMLGYGILLDFGFGFTAQKRVAELSVKREWDKLSHVLSTIFYSYVVVALVIIVVGYWAAPLIVSSLKISAVNLDRYTLALRVFMAGIGIAFPLGMFPEMLRGQQRISLANNLQLASYLVSFTLISIALANGWNLIWLFVFSLGGTLLGDFLCGLAAMRWMPKVCLSPSLFSRAMIHETTRFSIYAYISTLTTVILTRTDQIVISAGLAVAAVAIYQPGAKVGEMFSGFALQIAETLSPAAAHFHATGSRRELRELLVKGTRFTVLLATPLYLCCVFFLPAILKLLTGAKNAGSETYWVGQILLLWTYMMVLTQSCTKRIFMMCGHEKRLMWLGLGEALMNLGLSIAFIHYFKSVLAVAAGSLLATCFFGWVFIWPWAAKEAGIGSWQLVRAVLIPAWVACWPLLGLIAVIHAMPKFAASDSWPMFLLEGSIAAAVAAIGLWKLALDDAERAKFSEYFLRRFGKKSVA
jgi:O-antigen/teichoic acid export membrane protein